MLLCLLLSRRIVPGATSNQSCKIKAASQDKLVSATGAASIGNHTATEVLYQSHNFEEVSRFLSLPSLQARGAADAKASSQTAQLCAKTAAKAESAAAAQTAAQTARLLCAVAPRRSWAFIVVVVGALPDGGGGMRRRLQAERLLLTNRLCMKSGGRIGDLTESCPSNARFTQSRVVIVMFIVVVYVVVVAVVFVDG